VIFTFSAMTRNLSGYKLKDNREVNSVDMMADNAGQGQISTVGRNGRPVKYVPAVAGITVEMQ
jgi:hypothetical protein